jgi:hypothetical protein
LSARYRVLPGNSFLVAPRYSLGKKEFPGKTLWSGVIFILRMGEEIINGGEAI